MDHNTLKSTKRHSIGKYLRHKYMDIADQDQILHSDLKGDLPNTLKNYLDHLESNGLQYNKSKVSLTIMNKYGISLIAKESMLLETEIARIPQSLMLDTKKVFSREQLSRIIDQNQDFFVPDGKYLVEDRVLLLGLIYEYQLGEQSEYYHMINNFSKEINTVAFYEENVVEQFNDHYLTYWAREQKKFFNELANFYMEVIVPQYQEVFINKQELNVDVIRWLYIHIVTRTFGIGEFVTFVPFAEFLNHGYISSYGEFVNGNNNQLVDLNVDQDYQSDQSYSSSENLSTGSQDLADDYFSEILDDIDLLEISFNLTCCIGLKKESQIQLDSECKQAMSDIIMKFINEFDLGNNVNSIIFAKMLEKLKKLEGKQNVTELLAQLEGLEKMLEFLLFLVENQPKKHLEENYNHKVFKGMKQCKKMWDIDQEQKIVFINQKDLNPHKSQIFRFSEYESVTKYEILTQSENRLNDDQKWFALKVNPKLYYHQPVQRGQQIFYQYGRLSNRGFLTRYGFALEWNKYESHYIKINCTQNIKQISKEATLFMQQFKIQNRQAFKLKYTQFCFELLSYFRALQWSLEYDSLESIFNPRNLVIEMKALDLMKFTIEEELSKWDIIRSTNQGSIQMAQNYYLSKCHLLQHNIKLITVAIQFVKDLSEQSGDLALNTLRLNKPMELKILGCYFKDLLLGQQL